MKTVLNFVRFKDLENWSVSHIMKEDISYNPDFELIRIGDFLERVREKVEISDEVEYKRVKIKLYNNGVFLRDTEFGKNIGTKKQFLIKEGQFLISKIDARNGAFGLATFEVDKAIITADFLAFNIVKDKIEPYFLVLITTTKEFQKFTQDSSSGTTGRQRINESKFLDVKIPLPSLEKQKEIVLNYQTKIDLANSQEKEIKQIEQDIEKYLYSELGIEIEKDEKIESGTLQFVRFKDIKVWSVNQKKFILKSYKFPIKTLSEIATIGSGGTPSRKYKEYFKNGTIPWIKTGEVKDKIIYQSEEFITKEALNNSSAKLYPKNSLIIAMYGATAGRTAKLGIDTATNQACAVLHNINKSLNIDFVWFYLMSQTENFKYLSDGSAQPNLNSQKIKDYKIPLPPLTIQNQIANHIEKLKDKIKYLKIDSKQNRISALEEFEEIIFSDKAKNEKK